GTHEVLAFLRAADGTLFAATTPNGDVFRWSGPIAGVPGSAGDGAGVARLEPARPNPARTGVTLAFRLPRAGRAVLAVMDAQGRRVRALLDAHLDAGGHTLTWDRRDDAGHEVAEGLYFARLEFQGRAQACKLAVLR
ncbi:MAG: hypothetical protein HZC42_10760, partial [Candidatus Eisenbacteria bacterium]|nr:hypothetical protein [Candidatus Eisenbacteria bacterium]